MGLITWGVALMTGEISAFMPVTGGFIRHATKFVQPAFGTAAGWNFWYTMAITAPAELAAAATVIEFWNAEIDPAVWYTVFIVVIMVLNFSPVRAYGESEVFFAALKILLIVGLIIAGIVVDLGGAAGQNRIGFRYWKDPGPFNAYLVDGNTGKFLGFWSTLISAAYSYANVQVIALAGAETQNPRKVIPNAVRMTFWRILLFYCVSIFVVGRSSLALSLTVSLTCKCRPFGSIYGPQPLPLNRNSLPITLRDSVQPRRHLRPPLNYQRRSLHKRFQLRLFLHLPRLANTLRTCRGETGAFDSTSNESIRDTICCSRIELAIYAAGILVSGQQFSNGVRVVREYHDNQWDDWVDGDLRYVFEISQGLEESGH